MTKLCCYAGEDDYIIVVRYASSLVDALLFIHYLAVILLEVRHLQVQFAVKMVRSPDGVARTYTVGQLSVQRLASWCLDQYYTDFEMYNPYLDSVARRNSRRVTEFKVCSFCEFAIYPFRIYLSAFQSVVVVVVVVVVHSVFT